MFGYYQDRYQSADGTAQTSKKINVRFISSSSNALQLYRWFANAYQPFPVTPGDPTNQVTTDNTGYFSFYAAPGIYHIESQDGGLSKDVCVPVPGVPFGYVDARPDAFLPSTDHQALIQSEIDRFSESGGVVYLGPRIYEVNNLRLNNNTSLEGAGPSVTVLKQKRGSAGHVIQSIAKIGTNDANGAKHAIRNLSIDGQATRADAIASSPDNGIIRIAEKLSVSGGNSKNLGTFNTANYDLHANYYVEAVGMPLFTQKIDTVNAANQRIQLKSSADPATSVDVAIRRAYTVNIIALNSSDFGEVTAYTIVNAGESTPPAVRVGMLLEGPTDAPWGQDLWITEITATGFKVQRSDVLTSPVNNCTLSYYNCGIFAGEANYWHAEPYNSNLEYRGPMVDNVTVTNCSGDGMRALKGRDQVHVTSGCRMSANYGAGLNINSSNDCQVEGNSEFLYNWRQGIRIATSATPRVIGCTIGQSMLTTRTPDLDLASLAQASIVACDIFGTVGVTGQGSVNPSHGIRLSGVNFRWSSASNAAAASPSYVSRFVAVTQAAQVILDSPIFSGDIEASNIRPQFLWETTLGCTVLIDNMAIFTGAEPTRPYSGSTMGTGTGGSSTVFGMYLDMTALKRKWFGPGPVIMGIANADPAPLGAVGEVLVAQTSVAVESFTSESPKKVCELNIGVGDWEVSGIIHFELPLASPGNVFTVLKAGCADSLIIPDGPAMMSRDDSMTFRTGNATFNISLPVPPFRVSNTIVKTYYLVAYVKFVGSPVVKATGALRSRRVR